MKRTAWLVLFAVIAAVAAQGQEMDVIHLDSTTDQFDLAEIDSVTFGLQAYQPGDDDILRLHTQGDVVRFAASRIDSICFAEETMMTIYLQAGVTSQFYLSEIDSLSFASSASTPVSVTYSGASATVVNPLEDLGVAIDVSGADVTVVSTSGLPGVVYELDGSTTDGMFKVYADNDFTLRLDGVQIASADGPAINIQADETIWVELAAGTTSVLTDGLSYADPPDDEDQKAAFFSEGQLIFSGTGGLIVDGQGDDQHGLGSDDYIEVRGGDIVIQGATKDGVHTNEGFYLQGGSVEVSSGSDGVDAGDGPVEIAGGALTVHHTAADKDALKCDGTVLITDGAVALTVAGDQSKGINAVDVQLTGGTLTIDTSGGAVLEAEDLGYDPSYCTAIKADDQVLLDGAQVTITTVGEAGRGISCDGVVLIHSGSLDVTSSGDGASYVNALGEADAYHGPCIKADGDLELTGGTVTLSHSGSGGKGISGDADLFIGTELSSPTLVVTAAGSPIPYGFDEAAEAKAVSVDSTIVITSGDLTLDAADDAIKSKYWIEIDGGLINIVDSLEGIESPNLIINDGEIHVMSTDDGLNATYGVDAEYNDGSSLVINGGYVHLEAPAGDGIDSNGDLTINGGTVLVYGPPNAPEVGIDVNGSFLVNGGFLIVSQRDDFMVEMPGNSSSQCSVMLRRNQTLSGGTIFHVEDTAGTTLATFAPAHDYSNILLSSPDLTNGTAYRVYTEGTCTGTEQDGLYTGGTYTPGTLRATFTSSGTVQTVNF